MEMAGGVRRHVSLSWGNFSKLQSFYRRAGERAIMTCSWQRQYPVQREAMSCSLVSLFPSPVCRARSASPPELWADEVNRTVLIMQCYM